LIFRRKHGRGPNTRLFEDLDPHQRAILSERFVPREGELPIIASVDSVADSDDWFVLTNERIVWSSDGISGELPNADVHQVLPDLQKRQRGPGMMGVKHLLIVTAAGAKHSINLDPGQPVSATWKVLDNLASRNRNGRQF